MPDATITSTASTFGTITGTFAADQSTVTGTVTGIITGTLSGSVGVPGPKGDTGPQGQQGEPGEGVPAGGLEGQILLKASDASYDTVWADNSAETLTATVRNETGATLSKGTVVYITGAAGNKALVSKASASSEATSSKTFAILAADIPNNQNGTAVTVGILKNLDTSGLTEGGSLWLSTTAGQWTQTMPTAPNHAVFLGTVTRVHANQGTVEVRIQNGYELQELHNVKITSVANGQVLKYDSAQSLWVNGTDVGVPAGGTAGQFLQKIDSTDYNTDWVTLNLSAYLTKAGNLSGLTDLAASRDNLGLGSLSTPTFAGVNVPGSGTSVANLGATFLTLNQQGHGQFTIQPSQGIVFPDATVQTTAYPGPAGATAWGTITGTLSNQTDLQTALDGKYSTSNPAGYITSSALTGYATESWVTAGFYPLASNPAGYLTSAALTPYLLSSTAASTYYPLTNPAGYITSAALTGYATESWVTSQGYLVDAPSDGNQYARKDGAWDIVSAPSSYISSVSLPLDVTSGNLSINLSDYAPLDNPAFTGFPTAPTRATSDNDVNIATTAFVKNQGYLTSSSLTGYATESWVGANYYPLGNPSGYITSSALSPYLLSSTAASTYQTIAGMSSYLTTASAASTYYPLTNPSGYITTSALTGYATESWVTSQGYLTSADLTGYATESWVTAGFYPLTGNPSGFLTSSALTGYATESWVTSQGYLTSAPVTSVAGRTGAITLSTSDISGLGTMATESASDYSTTTVANGLYYPLSSNPAGYLTSAPVTSVAGRTGAVTLSNTDISGLGTMATVNDAPSDGNEYVRKNAAWSVATGGGGGGVDIQTFGSPTTSGTYTWTKPVGAKWVEIWLWGAGGGGASGARQATTLARSGGSAGSGGTTLYTIVSADLLGSTESVVVAAGRTGAAGRTTDGNSVGGSGTGDTTFSAFRALSGNNAPSNPASSGGNRASLILLTSSNGGTGQTGNTGAGFTASGPTAVNYLATGGGGGAGAAANVTTNVAGGGGGAFSNSATSAGIINTVAGGSGGTAAGVQATNGVSGTNYGTSAGTGGGGGYYRTGEAGGNGGNGGWPGGGGGGGGASDTGFTSGAGGNGANGYAVIITHF